MRGTNTGALTPYHTFPASLYESGESRIIPLDLSDILNCVGPATGPGLLANFIRINGGDRIVLNPVATSQIIYVIDGFGVAEQDGKNIPLDKGSFLAFPGGLPTTLRAVTTLKLYYVNDTPLLSYLGVGKVTPRFSTTLYGAERAEEELRKAAADKDAGNRSRISVLLGNTHFPHTCTVTHVLWAMFGTLPGNSIQKPHCHQSIALDYIVDCPRGCYSLVGTKLDEQGNIADATRVDWEPGMSFVTPPGYWHTHINESSEAAKLIPVQDAGLQTFVSAKWNHCLTGLKRLHGCHASLCQRYADRFFFMKKATQENDMLTARNLARRALGYGCRRGTFFRILR